MIPKKIHYCWFGYKPLPSKAIECIESWRKYAPDAEIIEWNETNFDINLFDYTKEAYDVKKYAFVSDVARLKIIYDEGGIYLDTDVELVKNIEDLFQEEIFMGQQSKVNEHYYVNTGLGFGAVAGNKVIKKMLDEYKEKNFINSDGTFNTLSCPVRNSKVLYEYGLMDEPKIQFVKGVTIYPPEFFCPMDAITGKLVITNNTYSIHHFSASWLPLRKKITKKIKKIMGPNLVSVYEIIKARLK